MNFDLSAYKQFVVTEGKRLELRAEFFNAFNRPNSVTADWISAQATSV